MFKSPPEEKRTCGKPDQSDIVEGVRTFVQKEVMPVIADELDEHLRSTRRRSSSA
ncbi:MAG: hypothetical protein U1F09_16755 [Steroidobacteraceae bacterium]